MKIEWNLEEGRYKKARKIREEWVTDGEKRKGLCKTRYPAHRVKGDQNGTLVFTPPLRTPHGIEHSRKNLNIATTEPNSLPQQLNVCRKCTLRIFCFSRTWTSCQLLIQLVQYIYRCTSTCGVKPSGKDRSEISYPYNSTYAPLH